MGGLNETEFKALVRKMRSAQKSFFKTKSTAALGDSKRLEAEVDTELERDAGQGMLFDDQAKGPY